MYYLRILRALVCFMFSWPVFISAEVKVLKFPPVKGIDQAQVYFEAEFAAKKGVLILCPGMNGDGRSLMSEASWREFALVHELGLVGISFSSPVSLLYGRPGTGYYYPEQGSGDILLKAIEMAYGPGKELYIYGFSGGAQFGSRFADQYSNRVKGWAAYSASFWSEPRSIGLNASPGIIACGEYDAERYGPSFAYFQQGRRKDCRWTWVSLASTGHVRHRRLENFIRSYFDVLLSNDGNRAVWFDAETKLSLSEDDELLTPSLSVWLPSSLVADEWQRLHHP